jgi:hypothetical protein
MPVIVVTLVSRLLFPRFYRHASSCCAFSLRQDVEASVVGCAVNVLCHLVCSSSAPSSYLPLAPPLFSLLTQSSNTWLVIKLVKLFGVLAPPEPRLAGKLAGPLMAILRHTPAKSLAYECVRTAIAALPDHPELTALCAHKLHVFIQDADPNLRYLGKGHRPSHALLRRLRTLHRDSQETGPECLLFPTLRPGLALPGRV